MKRWMLGLLLISALWAQKFEGLALTPPMGWNSWNHFGCDVNEAMIREATDAMVSSGMRAVGYEYIVIDDCWEGERDSLGFIQADPDRFPSGLKALGDYIHSMGLKFGIHGDAGWKTCAGRPASRGYEFQDAMQFAAWGVDYLKYDWCETQELNAEGAYLNMRQALYAAGRPILLSICEWGDNQPWKWAEPIGHMWRTTGDIINCFDCVVDHGVWKSNGIMQVLDMQDGLRKYAGPDHWNDPDMMEVGNLATTTEDRAHFTLWCILAAPLIAGNDLQAMSKETREILTNAEAIAVDQDALGIQGFRYMAGEGMEVWFKPLVQGDWAVAFLNRSLDDKRFEFKWDEHAEWDGHSGLNLNMKQKTYAVRDLWDHKDIGTTGKPFKKTIASHDAMLFRLTPLGD